MAVQKMLELGYSHKTKSQYKNEQLFQALKSYLHLIFDGRGVLLWVTAKTVHLNLFALT